MLYNLFCSSCDAFFTRKRQEPGRLCKNCYSKFYLRIYRAKKAKPKLQKIVKTKKQKYLELKIWRANNPEKVKAHAKKCYEKHKPRIKRERKLDRIVNKKKIAVANHIRYEKIKSCPIYKLKRLIKKSVWKAFKYAKVHKTASTFKLLKFTTEDLQAHRNSFLNKPCVCGIACGRETIITETNSHIDHIKPLVTAKTEEDIIILNSLENLRLICIDCNLCKGGKWEESDAG